MTECDKFNKINYNIIVLLSSSLNEITNNSSIRDDIFLIQNKCSDSNIISLNIEIVVVITDTIIKYATRLDVYERINNRHIIGKICRDNIIDTNNVYVR